MTQVTVRVILKSCHTDCNYCLTVRNGIVVVSPLDRNDRNQYWTKEMKHEFEKDAEGIPSFALINKGTGEALQHYGGGDDFTQPCKLVAYDPNELWPTTLFTEGKDIHNDGFKNVRLQNYTDWHLYVKWNETFDESEVCQGQKDAVKSALWKMEIQLDSPIPTKTYRIWCVDAPFYSLGVRNGLPVMVFNNPADPYQNWIVDSRYNIKDVNKDELPAFALINKGANRILRDMYIVCGNNLLGLTDNHSPNVLDENAAWTMSRATFSSGFRHISSNYNTKLTTIKNIKKIASESYKEDIDGLPVFLDSSSYGNWKLWKIAEHETFRIFTKVNPYYSLTIRNREVVLANPNPDDLNQRWFKDERPGLKWKDIEGKPAFALVNIGTGLAIWSVSRDESTRLTADYDDDLSRWSEMIESDGFRFIRRFNNIKMLFDAEFGGDHTKDGTRLVISTHQNMELAANANHLKWNIVHHKVPSSLF